MLRSLALTLVLTLGLSACDATETEDTASGAFDLLDGEATVVLRTSAAALNSEAIQTDGIELDSLPALFPFALPLDATVYVAARLTGATDLGSAIGGIAGGEAVLVFPSGTSDVWQALSATATPTTGEGEFDLFVDDQLEAVFALDDTRVVVASRESIVRAMIRRSGSARLSGDARTLIGKTDAFPVGVLVQDSGLLLTALLGDDSPIPPSALPFRRAAIGSTLDASADASVDATIWLEPIAGSDAAGLAGLVTTIGALAAQSPDLDEQTRALLANLSPVVDGRFVRITVALPLDSLLTDID